MSTRKWKHKVMKQFSMLNWLKNVLKYDQKNYFCRPSMNFHYILKIMTDDEHEIINVGNHLK